jgi:hypothetical protein
MPKRCGRLRFRPRAHFELSPVLSLPAPKFNDARSFGSPVRTIPLKTRLSKPEDINKITVGCFFYNSLIFYLPA